MMMKKDLIVPQTIVLVCLQAGCANEDDKDAQNSLICLMKRVYPGFRMTKREEVRHGRQAI